MKKDIIYSLKSLLTIKDRTNFSINYYFNESKKLIKINNSIYLKDRHNYKITEYFKDSYSLKTFNSNSENRLPILIKHTIFNFYIEKYSITDKYLIKNISEFYRLTKVFVGLFNKKYGKENQFEIDINHDVVFSILKDNENKYNDIEKYKIEKIENIFSKELFDIVRRL